MGRAAILTSWCWLDAAPRTAWQQMAVDRALADRAVAGQSVYRLYRWSASAISFGANEAAQRTWNRAAIDVTGTPCVRRPTGGRGVWHDAADLTYAAGAPLAALGGLRLAYRVIHEQLARAFDRAGVRTSLAPTVGRPTLTPGACFDLAVGGEVLIGNRKAVGSAQAVFGSTMLQHGAIALADRRPLLARFTLDQRAGPPAAVLPAPAPALDAGAVHEAIAAEWRDAGMKPVTRDIVDAIEDTAAQWAGHFQDAAWTWRR